MGAERRGTKIRTGDEQRGTRAGGEGGGRDEPEGGVDGVGDDELNQVRSGSDGGVEGTP